MTKLPLIASVSRDFDFNSIISTVGSAKLERRNSWQQQIDSFVTSLLSVLCHQRLIFSNTISVICERDKRQQINSLSEP